MRISILSDDDDSAAAEQVRQRFAYYAHDHASEYAILTTDEERKQFTDQMATMLDSFGAPDGAFWKKLQDTVGKNYIEELYRIGFFDVDETDNDTNTPDL